MWGLFSDPDPMNLHGAQALYLSHPEVSFGNAITPGELSLHLALWVALLTLFFRGHS